MPVGPPDPRLCPGGALAPSSESLERPVLEGCLLIGLLLGTDVDLGSCRVAGPEKSTSTVEADARGFLLPNVEPLASAISTVAVTGLPAWAVKSSRGPWHARIGNGAVCAGKIMSFGFKGHVLLPHRQRARADYSAPYVYCERCR